MSAPTDLAFAVWVNLTISPLQAVLSTLRYTYVTSGEELPGQREISIMASDGVTSDLITLTMDVVILNNNSPQLTLAGRQTASFVENATSPAPIGAIQLMKFKI